MKKVIGKSSTVSDERQQAIGDDKSHLQNLQFFFVQNGFFFTIYSNGGNRNDKMGFFFFFSHTI